MKAPFDQVLLAKPFVPGKVNPKGWYMSEKLDGVRAIWDGRGNLWSRNGKRFDAPDRFTRMLPTNVALDGELTMGRGTFPTTISAVRSHGHDWAGVKFHVFDMPPLHAVKSNRNFRGRYDAIEEVTNVIVKRVTHTQCRGLGHLMGNMDWIISKGGEGVMLRDPWSLYEWCRSGTLLKVKRFLDAEATVIRHVPGKGKHLGRLGALECLTKDDVAFNVGTGFSDSEREQPPAVGSVITFRYQELTKAGVPRFPIFVSNRDYE